MLYLALIALLVLLFPDVRRRFILSYETQLCDDWCCSVRSKSTRNSATTDLFVERQKGFVHIKQSRFGICMWTLFIFVAMIDLHNACIRHHFGTEFSFFGDICLESVSKRRYLYSFRFPPPGHPLFLKSSVHFIFQRANSSNGKHLLIFIVHSGITQRRQKLSRLSISFISRMSNSCTKFACLLESRFIFFPSITFTTWIWTCYWKKVARLSSMHTVVL